MLPLFVAAWLVAPAVIDSAGNGVTGEESGGAALVLGTSGDSLLASPERAVPVVVGTSAVAAQASAIGVPPASDPVIGGEFGSPFEPFVVEARLFSRLPLDPTDIAALALLSPAATDGGDLGPSHPSIAGGTGFENRWFVDGFEVTDPGLGSFGPWSERYGTLGWSLPLAWVDRLAVTDAGQDPARQGAGGGVIDVVLPSGGNRGAAGASYSLRPDLAESSRRNPPGSGLRAGALGVEDGIAHASGPLVPNRLWFLAGVGFGATSRRFTIREGWALEPYGEETIRREHLPFVAKVAWTPARGQEIDLLWTGDRGGSDEGPQTPADLLGSSLIQYSGLRFSSEMEGLRWQGFFGRSTEVETTVSRAATSFQRLISESADRHQLVLDYRDGSRGGGIGFYEHERSSERLRATASARHTVEAAGVHHLRTGGGVESSALRVFVDRSGTPLGSFVDENGVEHEYTTGLSYEIHEADDGSAVYRVVRGAYESPVSRSGSSATWGFVEDRWMPIASLSLTASLRVEKSSLHGGGPGATRYSFPAMVTPRASVEWSALRDGRLVAGLEAGRVVTPVPLWLAERRMSGARAVSRVDYTSSSFDSSDQIAEGTVPIDGDTTHFLRNEGAGYPVLNGTGAPWYDELAAAVRWNATAAWRLDARVVHRELGQVVDDVLYYATTGEVEGDESIEASPVITNPGSSLASTCTEPGCWTDPRREYDALQVSVRGAVGKLDLLGSWRLSRLTGNYEGVWRSDSSRLSFFQAFDFPNGGGATDGNSGPLPLDRTHVVQLAGAFDASRGVRLGAIGWVRSGRARTEWVGHPVYQTPTQPHQGWGAAGREPGSASLDVRASWTRALTPLRVTAAIDVLNVFDSQTVERRAPWREASPGVPDPTLDDPMEFTPPRSVRLTIRGEY